MDSADFFPEITKRQDWFKAFMIVTLKTGIIPLFILLWITALPASAQETCPCTIWGPSDIPVNLSEADNQPLEVGVKFRSSTSGYITGVRFYKSAENTGIHTGNLWAADGTNLARAIFTNETASGWQEVSFSTPVAINAGVTYVASYHTTTGHYSEDNNYFTEANSAAYTSFYLSALTDGIEGPNGVYARSVTTAFPGTGYIGSNYWVDAVFVTEIGPDVTPPSVVSVSPGANASGVAVSVNPAALLSELPDPLTVDVTSVMLSGPGGPVPGSVSLAGGTVTFIPSSLLDYTTTYTMSLSGGEFGIKDIAGNPLADDYIWSFTTADPPPPPPTEGPGGPVLVISSAVNPFSRYPVEILRAEGLNEFYAMDISQVSSATLNEYDVIILGEFPVTDQFVSDLTAWVTAGGTLIALRPDARLSSILGISPTGSTLSDAYLLVNTSSGPGVGIVDETIQFHSAADLYTLNGATSLATLYSGATTATTHPAVTEMLVGESGGKAYAFTYDLARSVVYTHQGNPAWAGQKRDGKIDPIRSDDMFVPPLDLSEPGWIDLDKVHIPQADEQQRLLANIIIRGAMHRKVLPRFWFLPKGLKAAVVMTGDNHGDTGMEPRFTRDIAMSPAGCSVDDWECVRSTGYFYVGSTYTNEDAIYYESLGFESAVHINTNCANFTPAQFESFVTSQLTTFGNVFPDIPMPTTNRNHCIAWSDWSTVAEVSAAHGIRLDANYYYWPNDWHLNRPGMFTGSANPMRFAKLDGTMIDVYQVVTQMQDEGHYPPVTPYPAFCDALLDKAVGPEGFYGVFCANMHFDRPDHPGANAITASAQARGVPVVSAKQMLEWLDGRNGSAFNDIEWASNVLTFNITVGSGARNLRGMLPVSSGGGELLTLTRGGSNVALTTEVIKGIDYAFFDAAAGDYIATYGVDETAPVITDVLAAPDAGGMAVITWSTDELSDSRVDYGLTSGALTLNAVNPARVTSHSITVSGLLPLTTYYYRVSSSDEAANRTEMPVAPATYNFTTPAGLCAMDATAEDFNLGTPDANTLVVTDGDGAVILRPAFTEDFTGDALPAGWGETLYPGGAAAVIAGGQVAVDATHIYTTGSFSPGSTLEFVATFGAGNYQNVGFASGAAFAAPWVTIGRGTQADNNLYARASVGGTTTEYLLGNLLNAPHNFKIKWNTDNFEFYLDGSVTPAVTIPIAISTSLVIQISDYVVGGAILSVDWIRASPYIGSGSFTSRIFDGGSERNWGEIFWDADVPDGTTLGIFVRGGVSAVPDGTWTPFVQVTGPGSSAGIMARYIQYRADLTASNTLFTPVLRDLSITCTDAGVSAPVITLHPVSQTVCDGSGVVFSSVGTGMPAPAVQWEVSDDGTIWTEIEGAVNSTLSLTAGTEDDDNLYRAVWSNTEGTVISNSALLTVNPLPAGTISPLRPVIYTGENYALVFNASSGSGPFTLDINGVTFTGIESGVPFSAGMAIAGSISIWDDAFTGGTQTVDASPTELGLAFTSSVAGTITGIRFYKHGTEAIPFTVSLWEQGNQTALATATYTSDNTAGWKQVSFATPVAVNAGTTYIASYHTLSSYFYAFNSGYTFPRVNGPLTATGGFYNNVPGYPGTAFAANYWVDVVFNSGTSGSSVFNLTSVTGSSDCAVTGDPLSSAQIDVEVARVWTGNLSADWNDPGNWSGGVVPDGENVVVPMVSANYPAISGAVVTNALVISPSAIMAINSGGSLTVNGDLTVSGELAVNSTLASSGSLIVTGTATGNIRYNRQLKPGSAADSDWHLASSPVATNSETNDWKINTVFQWSELTGSWTTAGLTGVTPGLGFNIQQEETSDGVISFYGPIANGDISVEVSSPYADAVGPDESYFDRTFVAGRSPGNQGGRGWNLLGNTYPSAINAEAFIEANYNITPSLSQFDPNYVALYLFDGTSRQYYYLARSTGWPSGTELNETHIQAGQGFFVLAMNDGSEFQFTRAMQEHSTGTPMLKSVGAADGRWPGLQLKVKHASGEAVITVVYGGAMTPGVDPGYDIGLYRSGQEMEVYTSLPARDNGINYTRQALPVAGSDTLVIPVGVDFKKGGEVTFSAETVAISGRRFWLEDRVAGTFTEMGLKGYTVTLPADTYGMGRFYIIASANTPTAIDGPEGPGGLRVWLSDRSLIIEGPLGGESTGEIFSLSGKKLLQFRLDQGNRNIVELPEGINGIILLRINDGAFSTTRKLTVVR
jgi:hypothetical protein